MCLLVSRVSCLRRFCTASIKLSATMGREALKKRMALSRLMLVRSPKTAMEWRSRHIQKAGFCFARISSGDLCASDSLVLDFTPSCLSRGSCLSRWLTATEPLEATQRMIPNLRLDWKSLFHLQTSRTRNEIVMCSPSRIPLTKSLLLSLIPVWIRVHWRSKRVSPFAPEQFEWCQPHRQIDAKGGMGRHLGVFSCTMLMCVVHTGLPATY